MEIRPVTLTGRYVRLEPLTLDHHAGFCAVGFDESIWRWNPSQIVRTPEDMRSYLESALRQHAAGESLPFATIDQASAQPVGSTRFCTIDLSNRRLEIGYTWIAPPWQRTAVNTEAKYLMMRHAFETLGCIRVEFKTDSLNDKSRRALAGIGAIEEGTFRNHMLTHTGRLRHSVYFGVIDTDWPEVKRRLEAKLAR